MRSIFGDGVYPFLIFNGQAVLVFSETEAVVRRLQSQCATAKAIVTNVRLVRTKGISRISLITRLKVGDPIR